MNVALAC